MTILRTREDYEREEAERLASFAVKSGESRGRVVPEPPHPHRTAFQRDRDRIIHSRAFRRLEYKTQVFVHHEGDHYRNRLTHTIEGSQIARTVARTLRLNEDLAESVALAHDLGHTPFGHAGEEVLDRLLEGEGGFDHNRQSVRVVDLLEERYPGFRGLNLTWETREGLLKHGRNWEHPLPLPEAGANRSLEAQVADRSDEIAYTSHDLDDGLRSELLDLEMLDRVPLWRGTRAEVEARTKGADEPVKNAQTIVALINQWVTDLVEATAKRIADQGIDSADAVRRAPTPLVRGSEPMHAATRELKRFLMANFYQHPRVTRESQKAEAVLGDLFRAYREKPDRLPSHVKARFEEDGEARAIADYIAGMTDRFALEEHASLRASS